MDWVISSTPKLANSTKLSSSNEVANLNSTSISNDMGGRFLHFRLNDVLKAKLVKIN